MTIVEQLTAARVLLTPDGAWTTGAFARDSSGLTISPHHDRARCWCISGALKRTSGSSFAPYEGVAAAVRSVLPTGNWASEFNDAPGRTQAEVLALLDTAIARATGGQS